MRLSPVLLAVGVMLGFLGLAMVPCALLDAANADPNWQVFALWAFACITAGMVLAISAGNTRPRTGPKEAFILTVLVWIVLSVAAALPFVSLGYEFTDALFEAVSGITTTGATVFVGLDTLPQGTLLWRAILQWIGGVGIIVTAIAILPFLQVGGMQLFKVESSDQTGKFMPRVAEIAAQMSLVYLLLSVACAILYAMSGMTPFDAITHSMTTMSAGGFSTHDASFGHFEGTPAIYVAILFMFIAGLPFSLLALALLHGRIKPMLTDPQPRLYLGLALGLTFLIVGYHELDVSPPTFENRYEAFRDGFFNIISVMTGTGYASAGYDKWGTFVVGIFFFATFTGGCAGSAACGIKMFRIEIAVKTMFAYAARMVRPNRVVPIRYGDKPVPDQTLQSVMIFLYLYAATFFVSALLLNLLGNDLLTSISAAATSVSNVGPGLGPVVGPEGNFSSLSDGSKWVCLIAMLLGRLEFVSVFVVLMPRFWRG